jgi:hypothetical protein
MNGCSFITWFILPSRLSNSDLNVLVICESEYIKPNLKLTKNYPSQQIL